MEDKLVKEQKQEKKRKDREAAKVVRDKEKADKAAERARKKKAKDHEKAPKSAQKGKRKALEAAASKPTKKKCQNGRGAGVASSVALRAASPEPPRTTSRGRIFTLPLKYK